ncbi:MAG: translocation/assembly module TamB [Candidatus Omnitrophica bacterium]|nr:translocation/assembly module TamB [Candidatus Omnitrophota bacterium]
MSKNVRIFQTAIVAIVFIGLVFVYFLFFNKAGLQFFARMYLAQNTNRGLNDVKISKTDTRLPDKIIYQDIEISNLKFLPQGATIKIQQFDFWLNRLNLSGVNFVVQNGRLNLPDSDVILFYGSYENSQLNFTVYSKQVNIQAILDLFFKGAWVKNIAGVLKDLDIIASGELNEPQFKGAFYINNLKYKRFSLRNCPANLELGLRNIKKGLEIQGELLFKRGVMSGPKTAVVYLKPSKIIFTRDPKNPSLSCEGSAVVGPTQINITAQGEIKKPNLRLTSFPPQAELTLLMMLATGKNWQGTQESISAGRLTPELAADFIDYFIFGGQGRRIAKKLGLSDISVQFNGTAKGVAVMKEVSDKTDLRYGIEQSHPIQEEEPVTRHKVGVDYKVTESDSVSLEAEKELSEKKESVGKEPEADDQVWLKFRKQF